MSPVYAPGASFDERRNTSRVFPVTPGSADRHVVAMRRHHADDWYRWIVARQRGEHLHGTLRADGKKPSCCPVHGCDEL